MEIKGAVALVTGANRGIGAALVDALVKAGAKRVYAGMRNPPAAVPGSVVVPVALDITDDARVAELARELGDVDILVNNAGISTGQPLLGAKDAHGAEQEMRVNYFGTLAMARAFAPILKKNGGGALVNVLSILSRVNLPASGSYSASKAAAFSLTQGIRAELARQKTLVIGVMPSFVDTDMTVRVNAPKMAATTVASDVVAAILAGTEDVYPGEAADIAAALQREPRAVAKSLAGAFYPA